MHILGRSFSIRQCVQWVLVAGCGTACLTLAISAARLRQQREPGPPVSLEPAAIQGFRTALYRGDRLRLRAAGDLLTISNVKAFGPFSFGFLRSIAARNVTVELYPETGDGQTPGPVSSLGELPALLGRERGVNVSRAELAPVRVLERRDGESRVVLTARSCSVGMTTAAVVCRDGVLDKDGVATSFREVCYNGRTLTTAATCR